MNEKNKSQDHLKTPFRAYNGDNPYIFVSYAHVDANRVFPEIVRFHNQGYDIWYDQGISPGSEWPEEIEEALDKSSLFVVFVSAHAVESRNVRNEINFALKRNKPFIAIFLEETDLKYGLELSMGSIQGILKYSMGEEEYVFKYSNAFEREGITPSQKPGTGMGKVTGEGIALKRSDAYVFASYDKRDEELVLPELKRLRARGVNIKCIDFDNEWSEDTESRILNSSLFLVYITSNSVNSLIVRDEISLAHLEDIPFIVIYLEEVELKYGLKLQMASKESINRYEMGEEEYGERFVHSLKRYGFELAGSDGPDGDYVYASFDVKDTDEALSQIGEFRNLGLDIVYGTGNGEDEADIDRLLNAALFVVFVTPNSIKSNVVRDEIYLALSEDIPFIAIHLAETRIGAGLKRQLDLKPAICRHLLDGRDFTESCVRAFEQFGFRLADISPVKDYNERLTGRYLKEFDRLNTTTESIFDLDGNDVLIILKDGTNLTHWDDVKSKESVIYISENLTGQADLSRKYEGFKSLKAIVTSAISDDAEDMRMMFAGCASLADISGLESWDTSRVSKMNSMFKGCASLADLKGLEGWDTGHVRDMSWMFQDCTSLSDLTGLGGWNTRNVTHLSGMFSGCASLADIGGLGSWDMASAVKINGMFSGCASLEDIRCLEGWNTSKVTKMNGTFSGCASLEDISGLEGWDASKVTRMYSMFSGCASLTDISCLEGWDTGQVKDMNWMFQDCTFLTGITGLESWNTSKVASMNGMFSGCASLTDISCLGSWDTRQVRDMNGMFKNCRSITDLSPLSNWDAARANKSDIFSNCKSAKAYPSWY